MPEIAPVTAEATFAAPPELLFDAFTDPKHLQRWFARTATIDLSPGGAWRFEFTDDMSAAGHVREAERPSRYVWTWEESVTGPHTMPSNVQITYTFSPIDGGTLMQIEESGHETEQIREMNEQGVAGMIDQLRAYVEDRVDPAPATTS